MKHLWVLKDIGGINRWNYLYRDNPRIFVNLTLGTRKAVLVTEDVRQSNVSV